jgi:hypothetical protein
MILLSLTAALFFASIKADDSVVSILSTSSSRRIAAITDNNFKDWQSLTNEIS